MLNQLILIGRVVDDITPQILEDGKKVLNFTLAVQRSFKNYDGEYDTDFLRITAWEGLASVVEKYLEKGLMIAVKARVQMGQYKINEEKKVSTMQIIAERITYLSQSKKKFLDELNN